MTVASLSLARVIPGSLPNAQLAEECKAVRWVEQTFLWHAQHAS